ncbi:MAG: hypothetical protein KGJ84_03355 [Elusimicrobia bacterium]|nr:hypothetical protein [Elusimicrobiota bacterium]
MKFHVLASLALAAACLAAWPRRVQARPLSWTGEAEDSVAEFAGKAASLEALQKPRAEAANSAAMSADIPGVRETVRSLKASFTRTCVGGLPRYALYPVSQEYGPSVSAAADSLQSDYLYPQMNNLLLTLAGDGPGAALSIGAPDGARRVLGTIAPEGTPCREYPAADVRLDVATGVAVVLSVEPRTGIFRPACYHDPINGFYKLDTWTILTVAFPQETMTIKTADGASFPDKEKCLNYYGRLKTGR